MFEALFAFAFFALPFGIGLAVYAVSGIIYYKRKNPRLTVREIMNRI